MALGINTNVASLSAQNQLNSSQRSNDQALERLSSGLRINSAKDDAAGLAISTRFSAQISGQNVAQRNANDGISYAQTAEGALDEVSNALSRIRDLAVQSANDTNSSSDRQALNQEVEALVSEVNRIAESTQFNGQNVLDGTLEDLVFQVGANRGQTISVDGVDTRGSELGAKVSTSSSITDTALGTLRTDDNLSIQGVKIDASDVSNTRDLANAINDKQGETGISASLANEVESEEITTADLAASAGDTFRINGVEISAGADDGATIDNINALSNQTGVTATDTSGASDGSTITLSNSSGAEIELTDTASSGDADETYYAGIQLAGDVSDEDFTVTNGDITVDADLGAGQSNETLNGISVLTREDAGDAIQTVDFALDQVNSTRAELGAVQSRFESTISNLASSTENLSAANSRILDADFAAETANLSKSQVLQQAGISVLAQANARPQQVLSLLQ